MKLNLGIIKRQNFKKFYFYICSWFQWFVL